MAFVKILSFHIHLFCAEIIHIEVDVSRGLNHFSIVGLAGKAIDEAKERMSVAIKNCGFVSPLSKNNKTIISLSPADIKKEGPHFDLALALAYLLSVEDICFDPEGKAFVGELALDGSVRPIKMPLAYVMGAKKAGLKEIYIPAENINEVDFVSDIHIFPVTHLKQVIAHLNTKRNVENIVSESISPVVIAPYSAKNKDTSIDFADVKGQENAKRALEIAASGKHNVMLYGPPGTGKTMLAKAFAHILPDLTLEQCIETSSIHNSLGFTGVVSHPPFRSPHHSSTLISLIGGGNVPRAGEITLAHNGVLFTDELPEFSRQAIDSLRQPLEDKVIHVSRSRGHITFPSDFILIASMNRCPCGYFSSTRKQCSCSDAMVNKYQKKISGPIIDRIDIWVEVSEIDYEKFHSAATLESSKEIKQRVCEVRSKTISQNKLSDECFVLLKNSSERLGLSPRMYHRIINVARTIAYMDNKKNIHPVHILEALQYRPKF